MNKKEIINQKVLRQQEIVNGSRAANRDLNSEEKAEFDSLQREIDKLKSEIAEDERAAQTKSEAERAVRAERQRVGDITSLCREFGIDPGKLIEDGSTMDQARQFVLEEVRKQNPAVPAGIPDFRMGKDEADKFRDAASDSILLRGGKTIEKPAPGAPELRGMRLRDLAVECVMRKGIGNAQRLDDDALFREAMTPDSQFSGILTNTVNKSMATAYKAANTTYKAWTRPGSNTDFKPTKVYQISEGGDLVPMTQNGEFKFDEMSDNGGVQKTLATFGKGWGFTRQALINDDLGMLVRVPEAYVRAAARGINKLVYKQLGSNPNIYDGKALFVAAHSNLAAAGDVIGTTAVGLARAEMRKQKNLRGKETLNIAPSYLIVPAALETLSQQFLWSIADPASANAGTANVFRNSLNLVVDAELDDYSGKEWYLAAAPGDIDTVEVTYLNGNDMPKLESQVGFDFLGIKWRIYIDYGVTVLDYRGLYKNPGK